MGRKQDALRGVESPLIFMASERGACTGSVGLHPSRRKALHNCSACSRRKCCRRFNSAGSPFGIPRPYPRRPEGTQTTTPDRDGTFVPVAIRIREPALPSPPNRMISTKLLLAFYSSKHSGQRSDTWPRFFKNEDRFQKEQE